MFKNTYILFLNTFNALLNIIDANACVLSVEFIYSVYTGIIIFFHIDNTQSTGHN